jgi:hypothetical protein
VEVEFGITSIVISYFEEQGAGYVKIMNEDKNTKSDIMAYNHLCRVYRFFAVLSTLFHCYR